MKKNIYSRIVLRVIGDTRRLLFRVARAVKCEATPQTFLAAFLLLSLGTVGKAQTGVIEGRVADPIKGVYLEGAEVSVDGASAMARTDSSGWYRLSDLPVGAVTLKVTYPGYASVTRQVRVEKNTASRQEFELSDRVAAGREGEVIQLDEFSVSASREMDARTWALEEQRNAANMKRVISADAFGDDATGNVGNFLKFFPGVNATGDGGDEPYRVSIRGMPASTTRYTVGGNPINNTPESTADRAFTLQELSLTNIARVEVAKSPLPSMWADFLGGSINLINKTAFERTKPQLIARVMVDFPAEDFSFDAGQGIGNEKTRRFNPGWEVSYINPVSKNFGFTLSALSREFFSNTYRIANQLSFGSGGTVAAPYLRTIDLREGARLTEQDSYSATADWRPVEALTLSFSFRWKKADVYRTPQRTTLNLGTTPSSFSATGTQGRAGAGSVSRLSQLMLEDAMLMVYGVTAVFRHDDWKVDLSLSESVAEKNVVPTLGGITTMTTTFPSATIAYADVNSERPQSITVRNSSGTVVDWGRLEHYRLTTVEDLYRHSETRTPTIRLDVRRAMSLGGRPVSVQAGAAFNEQKLTKSELRNRHTYLGPDGVANNADNTMEAFVNPAYVGEPSLFGIPTEIQWIDNQAIARHLASNPNQFVFDTARAADSWAAGLETFEESIGAAYLQAEAGLLENKLQIVGGVRFERTENYGEGLLNRNGTLVPRGTKSSRSYDNWFPSVNAIYSITPSLQARAAYSRTIGRPQMQFLIPNLNIQEASESITLRNPDLEAWISDNYDLSLAWYFGQAGAFSVGVFKKEIANAFVSNTFVVNEELRQDYGLDPLYLGWNLNTTTNSATPMNLEGVEADLQAELSTLLPRAKGISLFVNGTLLRGSATEGSTQEFPARRMASWGVSYSRGRIGCSLTWTYTGKSISSTGAFAPDGEIYIAPMTSLDANAQFRLAKRFRVFANVRNLNREPAVRYYEGTGLADYASQIVAQRDLASIRWTVGVAGEF